MAIRRHLEYGRTARPRFLLRAPELLFLGAVGLFLLTLHVRSRGGAALVQPSQQQQLQLQSEPGSATAEDRTSFVSQVSMWWL
jgi:hypothetical protein